MYDGNHTADSHYQALIHYYNCLDDIFVFIVDDWNWKGVRDGTYDSFKKLNLTILFNKEINEIQLDHLNIKSICKKVENEFFFQLMELFLKNKNLKEQLSNLKRDVQLNNQILNSTITILQQEEKNKSKLDQKCICFNY